MDELERALREHFGFEQFRPNQREVIEHVLAQRHTLAVLPTGSGKSLCYQLPAQLLEGLTLVISPLIALMQDQVEALARRGFKNVTSLSSALSPSEIGHRHNEIERGAYKLVYVAPERCDSPRFQQLVRQNKISLVVIDEAHCISQWGHDFRPHYRTLLDRLPELKRSTFLALTATATSEVRNDIVAALSLPSIERVIADFNRPSLHFEALRVDEREEKDARLIELLSQDDGAAIVYASTRKEAAAVHQRLESRGFNAGLYHAGLDAQRRSEAQHRFLQGDCRIIAATVAFGLGIDKPNVRRIVHYNVPGSLENYYQEAGRGGRDGQTAVCTLLYSQSDVRIQRFLLDQAYPEPAVMLQIYGLLRDAHPLAVGAGDLVTASGKPEIAVNAALQLLYEQQLAQLTAEGKYTSAQPGANTPRIDVRALNERRWRANERLKKMIAYALDPKCRRAQILRYFGQSFAPPCGACDVCAATAKPQVVAPQPEVAATEASDQAARAILRAAAELNGRFGRSSVTDLLSGSKRKRLIELGLDRSPHYGALRLHRREQVMAWIDELVAQGLLKVTAEEYPCLLITAEGRQAVDNPALIALSGFTVAKQTAREPAAEAQVATAANVLVERLKQWRREKAAAMSVPAYVVLHDSVVESLAHQLPRTLEELGSIKGIGGNKLAQFGAEILGIVHEVATEAERKPAASKLQSPHEPPRDWRLQVEIWRQGGAEPDRQTLLALLHGWRTREREELVAVINALKDLNAREAGVALLNLIGQTSDGYLLSTICEALGQLGVMDAVDDLIRLLDDERQSVRRASARSLGRLRARAATARLKHLAETEKVENVRLAATAALRLINSAPGG
jgi:ATP-dependent DNA helicase RecQ